jgi:hypothetical protein
MESACATVSGASTSRSDVIDSAWGQSIIRDCHATNRSLGHNPKMTNTAQTPWSKGLLNAGIAVALALLIVARVALARRA